MFVFVLIFVVVVVVCLLSFVVSTYITYIIIIYSCYRCLLSVVCSFRLGVAARFLCFFQYWNLMAPRVLGGGTGDVNVPCHAWDGGC